MVLDELVKLGPIKIFGHQVTNIVISTDLSESEVIVCNTLLHPQVLRVKVLNLSEAKAGGYALAR